MEKKENQRVVVTKRMLLEALLPILEKKHIREVSVTELCAKAGINRATFYKHYSTPNDVLAEMGSRYAAQLAEIQPLDGRGKSAEQVIEESCMFMYENREIIRLFIRNGMDGDMSMKALVMIVRRMTSPHMLNLQGLDETEQELLMTYVASGCYSLMKKWIMEDLPKTPREIAELLYRLFNGSWIDMAGGKGMQE